MAAATACVVVDRIVAAEIVAIPAVAAVAAIAANLAAAAPMAVATTSAASVAVMTNRVTASACVYRSGRS